MCNPRTFFVNMAHIQISGLMKLNERLISGKVSNSKVLSYYYSWNVIRVLFGNGGGSRLGGGGVKSGMFGQWLPRGRSPSGVCKVNFTRNSSIVNSSVFNWLDVLFTVMNWTLYLDDLLTKEIKSHAIIKLGDTVPQFIFPLDVSSTTTLLIHNLTKTHLYPLMH